MKKTFYLYTDGASRSNPGEAGIGFVLYNNEKKIINEGGFFIGYGTNNYAEYIAVIVGLILSKEYIQNNNIILHADSLLVVNQLNKEWKIKDQKLLIYFNIIETLRKSINLTAIHIPREKNQYADRLANKGIDEKEILPPHVMDVIAQTPL
jgi:ribonuclease HI